MVAAAAGGGAAPGFSVSQAGHLMVSAELRQKQPEHSHEPSLGLNRAAKLGFASVAAINGNEDKKKGSKPRRFKNAYE